MLSGKNPKSYAGDALVVGVAQRDGAAVVVADGLPRAVRAALGEAAARLRVSGAADSVDLVPGVEGVSAGVVALVGLGAAAEGGRYDAEVLRRAAGRAARALAGRASAGFLLPAGDAAGVGAVAEGAALGAYAFTRFRSSAGAEGASASQPLAEVTVLGAKPRDEDVAAAVERAGILARAVAVTRDLVNTPPGHLPPADFAAAAVEHLAGTSVGVRVLDEEDLSEGGYGGLLGVGQGSSRPPRLVVLDYAPKGATGHLALVGKGITFDSGGLSLKPASGMETMKCDMAGAAAVLAAVRAVADLGLPLRVTGWLAMAENMPSGTAQRPSDVLTTYGGKTVEVLNTDAEGRLVLADALVAAGEEEPDHIVDVATLTGAQMVALGNRVSAVMGNDDALRERFLAASAAAGEQFWPMPLPVELRSSMDSQVADIANMGDRFGGMLVAGLFLQEFVPAGPEGRPRPWIHLDIAGPAFNSGSPHDYTPKGGTGVAVRSLVALAESLAGSST
ncbi:leucyl aminopeptidase [Kineococcus xinjiangensis]|uniref:Probable cytosol aminopeptidase n=2 Tax=Kineococcus xinjiangensis TaxID=512762 RepID=A0A2S6IME0_9ACTN|nr:leucyl aminopeptidase [Kineococcus xinjiangensis]